ncbi:MAG TPA: anti-sigma factor [Stellaceae bacterium]|nr:anti-sigma factor [Stellaceae bacterium]
MSDSCENLLLVQAEFDGELDAAQSAALVAHRAQCPVCRKAAAKLQQLRTEIRRAAPYHRVPADLRARLMRARPARRAAWRGAALSFVAGAALAASVMLVIQPAVSPPGLADAVLAGHLRSLQPGHLEDVVSTDQHSVKPWFDGRLDFAPPVKDLAAQGFPLEGGRLDYIAERPVAALVYGHALHKINLFVWPSAEPDRAAEDLAHNGYNLVHWHAGGMTFWAVSDLEKDELDVFARQWLQVP